MKGELTLEQLIERLRLVARTGELGDEKREASNGR
jgi:hypothetical protein